MKKITLGVLALLCFGGAGIAQTDIIAPPNTGGNSPFRAPNGTQDHAYLNSMFFISHEELLPLNLATISSCSFQVLNGTGSIPVAGNFTLYMGNSNHMTYNVGTTFSSVYSQLTPVYVGTYTVPAAAGPATVGLNFTTPFAYTGEGVYVGYTFESTGPFAAASATYAMSHYFASPYGTSAESWLANASSSISAAATSTAQALTNFRPSIIWGAVNTATNELELVHIDNIEGKTATFLNKTQNFTARIVNSNASGAISSVSVEVIGSGANPFTDTVVVPSLAAGATHTVTFGNYNPTQVGTTTFNFAILNTDEEPANNTKTWTQEVTCDRVAQQPSDLTMGNGYGFSSGTVPNAAGSGIWSSKHSFPVSATLTGVNVMIGTDNANTGNTMSAVLLNGAGGIVATGAPVSINSGANVFFPFNTPQNLVANADYFIGVLQASATTMYYPIGSISYLPQIAKPYYTFGPTGATSAPAINLFFRYFAIEPELVFDELKLSAGASNTLVCKASTAAITLSVNGSADTYTWTYIGGTQSGTNIAITPTISGGNGPVFYQVEGTHSASGCKTEQASVTVSISACAGLNDLPNSENISLYPNPTADGVTSVKGLTGTNTIEVYNATGQVVLSKVTTAEQEEIDLTPFATGHYLVRIMNGTDQAKVLKLLHNK